MINIVIYGYLFICISLLFYNIFYMFYSSRKKSHLKYIAKSWSKEIEKQCSYLKNGGQVTKEHYRLMLKKLKKTRNLLAFLDALEAVSKNEDITAYLHAVAPIQQKLAYSYSKKDAMNRAFFAYVISIYSVPSPDEFTPMMEILLSYLKDSTVYCRENVLHALYALGNIKAVETALQIFNDNEWFHHPKLLADGLATFKGDKEALLKQLWSHYYQWDEDIILSVIQSITPCSNQYNEIFLPLLKDDETDLEIRLAILRYYRKNIYEPVKSVLYSFFDNKEIDENILVVTSFVLGSYPDDKTTKLLKKALTHHNWYVRKNAALSLINLKVEENELIDIYNGTDRYAKDILNYIAKNRLVNKYE